MPRASGARHLVIYIRFVRLGNRQLWTVSASTGTARTTMRCENTP